MSKREKKPKKKTKLSVKILAIIACVLLVAGLSLFFYPTVSNTVGTITAQNITNQFDEIIDNVIDMPVEQAIEEKIVDEEGYPIDEKGERTSEYKAVFSADLDSLYKDSVTYNNSLITSQGRVNFEDFSSAVLQLSNYGLYDNIYGYISAPTIGVRLPIYLGANDYNMSYGAAHLSNTSLPLDAKDTNVAIAAHTGYIGRIFFDNIKNLNIGDEVSIKNYWESISYTVIDKKIVDASDSTDVAIQKGRQLLTLITCISDGNGGFDRYIVICEKQ